MWSSSVSRDTSGRHLQTQEILQKDLADESRLEHLATGEDYMLLLLLLLSCIDGSPPGSPVPGILQARTLEWVAISFSNA